MNTPRAGPSQAEASELLRVARMGAAGAGASGAELDDVSQATAAKFAEKWDEPHVVAARGRGESGWHAYIVVAARNAYRDRLRRERRFRERELRADDRDRRIEPGPDRPGTLRRTDDQPSEIDEYLGRRLVIDLIDECLDGTMREIALRTYLDGLSTKEIAALVGLSIRSVNHQKRQAIEVLRDFLLPDPTDRDE